MTARYNPRQLSDHLRRLASEVFDIDKASGDPISRAEQLARNLWDRALGYKERKVDDEGKESIIEHRPEAWAMQMIYDRMEGKTPQAIGDDVGRVTATDQVRDLAKARINDAADRATAAVHEARKDALKGDPDDDDGDDDGDIDG